MKAYPIFLIGLNDRRCIVVGGGQEAERKVGGLLDCDAAVTLISTKVTPQLNTWAEAGSISWIGRGYQTGDFEGAYLVIAERSDAETNARIWAEAEAENALVNVMDDVPNCNFIAGSVVRQGSLTVSISTAGAAPVLAVRLRQRLERELGAEYATFLDLMQALREPLATRYPDFEERRALWYELVDSDILDLLRTGERKLVHERIAAIVGADLLPTQEV